MRVAIVAGEASGDLLGAGMITAIRAQYPQATFEGVAGPKMRAAGCEQWHAADELAVMGLFEVLRHLLRLLRLRRSLVKRWRANPPDVFVGIDAPDFNIGLELKLRRLGIPTVHYVSPSIWAWRQRRVRKIARACNRVLCLLPFEKKFYEQHQVAADFVGHPLAELIPREVDSVAARDALGLDTQARVVALLPGSRQGEIARLGADFVATAMLLRANDPSLEILVPLANEAGKAQFQQIADAAGLERVHLSIANARDCMSAADAVLLASGTATLEAMLLGKPMAVAYRLASSTYWLVRLLGLVKLTHFSLPNLLTERPLVREYIQHQATPQALAAELSDLLNNDVRAREMRLQFAKIHDQLARGADQLAAAAVIATAQRS